MRFALLRSCPRCCASLASYGGIAAAPQEKGNMKSCTRNHMKGKHMNDTVSKQRTYCVSVRFSAQEKEELDAARGRTAAGRFLREAFLQRKTIVVPECNRKAWSELSRSASNLNQIAHHLNLSGMAAHELRLIADIRAELSRFRASLVGARLTGEQDGDDR